MAQRQEAVNVVLAQLLAQRGLAAAPEQILSASDHSIKMPDVLVDFQGLRMAIEAEFEGETKGSKREARNKAFAKAETRVADGIAHIGVAIVYPVARQEPYSRHEFRRSWNFPTCTSRLSTRQPCLNRNCICSTTRRAIRRSTPESCMISSTRCGGRTIVSSTMIRWNGPFDWLGPESTKSLLPQNATRNNPSPGGCAWRGRLQRQPRAAKTSVSRADQSHLVPHYHQCARLHEALSRKHPKVLPLSNFIGRANAAAELAEHWESILTEINYFPIFATANQLLRCFSTDADFSSALKALVQTALKVASWRASLRHDLAGRIYHRLLEEAKYLGGVLHGHSVGNLALEAGPGPAQGEVPLEFNNRGGQTKDCRPGLRHGHPSHGRRGCADRQLRPRLCRRGRGAGGCFTAKGIGAARHSRVRCSAIRSAFDRIHADASGARHAGGRDAPLRHAAGGPWTCIGDPRTHGGSRRTGEAFWTCGADCGEGEADFHVGHSGTRPVRDESAVYAECRRQFAVWKSSRRPRRNAATAEEASQGTQGGGQRHGRTRPGLCCPWGALRQC